MDGTPTGEEMVSVANWSRSVAFGSVRLRRVRGNLHACVTRGKCVRVRSIGTALDKTSGVRARTKTRVGDEVAGSEENAA